jgi:hypothetical protein
VPAAFSTLLEIFRRQLMPSQQLIKVRAISLRQASRLTHIPTRDLEDLREIVASELVACLIE